jgi:hypothetical protein
MRKLTLIPRDATANPVYLTAAAISNLIQSLPSHSRGYRRAADMTEKGGRPELTPFKGNLLSCHRRYE